MGPGVGLGSVRLASSLLLKCPSKAFGLKAWSPERHKWEVTETRFWRWGLMGGFWLRPRDWDPSSFLFLFSSLRIWGTIHAPPWQKAPNRKANCSFILWSLRYNEPSKLSLFVSYWLEHFCYCDTKKKNTRTGVRFQGLYFRAWWVCRLNLDPFPGSGDSPTYIQFRLI